MIDGIDCAHVCIYEDYASTINTIHGRGPGSARSETQKRAYKTNGGTPRSRREGDYDAPVQRTGGRCGHAAVVGDDRRIRPKGRLCVR